MSCTFIALSAYQSLYPAMLVVPAAMYIAQVSQRGRYQGDAAGGQSVSGRGPIWAIVKFWGGLFS